MTSAEFQVDLSNCDREPIHTPGSIQTHGAMLVCDLNDGVITHHSANAAALLGTTMALIGANLTDVLGGQVAHDLRNAAARAGGSHLAGAVLNVTLPDSGKTVDASVHRHAGRMFVELEPPAAGKESKTALDLTQALVRRIALEHDVGPLAEAGARLVRALLGYDRVMVYRFLHNGAGQVIAEARRTDLHSFRGQHFPASDIPVQARQLYLLNWARVIGDVNFAPIPLVGETSSTVDMSYAHLRSVSSIHCQYLRNMGVAASLSISIVIDGKLWGLIACHHDTPRLVSLPLRISAELFGQYFSLQVAIAERRAEILASSQARLRLDSIITSFDPGEPVAWALQHRLKDMAALVPCQGVGLWMQDEWKTTGVAPALPEALQLIEYLRKTTSGTVWNSHELATVLPSAGFGADVAGVLAIPLSPAARDFLLWFRSEEAHEISWAGEPVKRVVSDGDSHRLTPRGSFEVWREDVRGLSTPWTNADVATAEAAQNYLRDVVLRYKEATIEERTRADRRRRLLNDELNHRVKNIISLIKSIALQTGARANNVADYAAALEGRLQALAFAHDQSLGGEGGNLSSLVDAETMLHRYGASPDRVTTSGPPVGLDGRAFSVMALLLHEMMTNAGKYGALSVAEGKLDIRWTINEARDCVMDWIERDGPQVSAPDTLGFGSTLIQNTIAYDLGGSADIDFAPQGVRARFVIPSEHLREPVSSDDRSPGPVGVARLLAGKHVLLVEDQALIAMDTEDALRQLGASHVNSVPTIVEALSTLSLTLPDCAVLDLDLGGEISTEIADELLAHGVPFIFATGYRDNTLIPDRLAHIHIVRKPLTAQALSQTLAAALLDDRS